MTHTEEKPYECDVCEKIFSQSERLKMHKRTHTGEKPYECDICQKKFSDHRNLKAHKRTHTGEKPHKCVICNKVFLTSSNLKKHKRSHLKDMLLLCVTCGREIIPSQDQDLEVCNSNHYHTFVLSVMLILKLQVSWKSIILIFMDETLLFKQNILVI